MSGYDYLALCAAKKTIFGEENILGKNLYRKKKPFRQITTFIKFVWPLFLVFRHFNRYFLSKNDRLMHLKPKTDHMNFYECYDLATQVYIFFDTDLR